MTTTTIETRTVLIPACDDHGGYRSRRVTLPWICPQCGGPRGDPHPAISYDGSRRLACDGWQNPCGHVDYYSAVRDEADRQAARIDIDACTCGHGADLHRETLTATGSGCTHYLCDGCREFEPETDEQRKERELS